MVFVPVSQTLRGRAFLAAVWIEAILLVLDRSLLVNNRDHEDTVWFSGIMAINLIFCVALAHSAIANENVFELYVFGIATVFLTVRMLIDWATGPETTITFIVVMSFQVLYFILGYFLLPLMDRKFYLEVGTDAKLKTMYVKAQRFASALKLDFQVGALLLFTGLFFSSWDGKYYLGIGVAITMILVEAAWEYLGVVAVRRENARLLKIFLFLGLFTPAYAIFFLVRFANTMDDKGVHDRLSSIEFRLILCTLLLITTRILLLYFGYGLLDNFGHNFRDLWTSAKQRAAAKAAAKSNAKSPLMAGQVIPPPSIITRNSRATSDTDDLDTSGTGSYQSVNDDQVAPMQETDAGSPV